ncbi:MAG: MMPL family transporter [Pseudomonadota bacterium]
MRTAADAPALKGQWLDRLAAIIATTAYARPVFTLVLLAILALASVALATTLRVDTDSSRMLNPDLPFQSRAQEINSAFPGIKNTILVVVRGTHRDAVTAATVSLVTALAAEEAAVARVFAPSVDPFFVTNGLLYDDLAGLRERLSRLGQSANLLARLRAAPDTAGFLDALDRAMTLAEEGGDPADLAPLMMGAAEVFETATTGAPLPFDWSAAFDDKGVEGLATATLSVEPVLDFTRVNAAKPALQAVTRAVEALPPSLAALVEIGVTGDPALRGEELASVTASLPISFGLSILLVALVLWLALGGWGRVGLALGAVVMTLILTTGVAALTVGALNLVSVAFVVLMVGLGIDFAIHFLAHLDEEAAAGRTGAPAIAGSMRAIGGALVLSAMTTALAFLAFTTGDFVGMAQLGIIGAAGVIIALVVALTLVPAAVALRSSLARGRGPLSLPSGVLPGRGPIFAAAALLALGAGVLAPSARFDADPMGLRDPQSASVVTYGWLAADPARAPLRLSVIAPDAEAAAMTAEEAAGIDGVENALWIGYLVPDGQDAKLDEIDLAWPSLDFAVNGDAIDLARGAVDLDALPSRLAAFPAPGAARLAEAIAAWRSLRENGEPTARDPVTDEALFRFFPQLMERLAMQLDVGPVSRADLPAALAERFVAGDGRHRVEIIAKTDLTDPENRQIFVDAVAARLPSAGGAPAQIEGAARAIGGAMLQATLLSLLATGALAVLVLRSSRMVLAILVPLALAGLVTIAFSALLGLPFNYANVIVLPLMIGIGVDTGIHIAMRAGKQQSGGVFATSTPRAALASALTTIAAFGTLALSDHAGTASMGFMLVIALTTSLVLIFALTPAILAPRPDTP